MSHATSLPVIDILPSPSKDGDGTTDEEQLQDQRANTPLNEEFLTTPTVKENSDDQKVNDLSRRFKKVVVSTIRKRIDSSSSESDQGENTKAKGLPPVNLVLSHIERVKQTTEELQESIMHQTARSIRGIMNKGSNYNGASTKRESTGRSVNDQMLLSLNSSKPGKLATERGVHYESSDNGIQEPHHC